MSQIPKTHETIVILDFGSQYTQLIARRVRAQDVLALLLPGDVDVKRIRALNPKGIILSGGPASVYQANAPQVGAGIFELGVPILGICYGMQIIAQHFGAKIEASEIHEYGKAILQCPSGGELFRGMDTEQTVWMSHADKLETLPTGFEVIGSTAHCPQAAIRHLEQPLFALQFHPEVVHTKQGERLLRNFVYELCGCQGDWTVGNMIEEHVEDIRQRVGKARVLTAVSGGVDSTVLAALVHRAVPDQVETLFVDNGLLRLDEVADVEQRFAEMNIPLRTVHAADQFLGELADVEDPEIKRVRIGHTFIRVFEEAVRDIKDVRFLAQGTLYPDVIESSVNSGHSATIKTHHNVGGLPKDLEFELVEPLRDLFKDEVRRLGTELKIDERHLMRHPFPGPGLAVRILGAITEERLDLLRQCDEVFMRKLVEWDWYSKTWQAFAVLLPVRSVGVMGDGRTYEHVVALRAVDSIDGMTSDWTRLPYELLAEVASEITNRVRGVNRVVYDISSKPPSTIEWE